VGLQHLQPTLDTELRRVQAGAGEFKAVRGEYGCGKTFFSRWLADRARQLGFVTAEVQISETETPLHRLETVYRRLTERMLTSGGEAGGFRRVIDGWFYTLEQDVLDDSTVDPADEQMLLRRTSELLDKRLAHISKHAPMFSIALRGYRELQSAGEFQEADAILAWLGGQPNVAASARRRIGIRGDIDHFAALNFLQGILAVLRDSGKPGLLLVLDEVETIQRVRSDVRDKSLNALRQMLDEIDTGRFPGLYLLITGTTSFFEGPQGISRLAPLSQRLHVEFSADAQYDNHRAVQIRLPAFDLGRLVEVGQRVRDIYCSDSASAERIHQLCDDTYIQQFATAVSGQLGGRTGLAPRIFLKKLVDEVLDRIDLHPSFQPRRDHQLRLTDAELSELERGARQLESVDDIELPL
jgi:hypothetical protein